MSEVIKTQPQAPEVERILLGYLLLNGSAIEDIMAILPSGDLFYKHENQKIYQAMIDYCRGGYGYADAPMLLERLKASAYDMSWFSYMMELMDGVISCDVVVYALTIREKYMLREVIRISERAIAEAYRERDVFEVIEEVSHGVDNILNFKIGNNVKSLSDIGVQSLREIAEKRADNKTITGIPSGISPIDKLTGGWQDTDLIYIAARPSVGKTAVLLNLCLNAAHPSFVKEPISILVFSMEMSDRKIFNRILSRLSGVALYKISKAPGTIDDSEWVRMERATNEAKNIKIYIDDSTNIDPLYIRTTARKAVKKHGVKMVVVDYLQLMRNTEKKGQNREQEVANISVQLKATAKDLKIPIIALAQLNRAADEGEPELSHIRESGAIEQDGDVIALLWRPSKKEIEENPLKSNMLMFSIKKNRDGSTDDVPLYFNKETQEIKDWEDWNGRPDTFASIEPPNKSHREMNQAYIRNFSEPKEQETDEEAPF